MGKPPAVVVLETCIEILPKFPYSGVKEGATEVNVEVPSTHKGSIGSSICVSGVSYSHTGGCVCSRDWDNNSWKYCG